MMIIRFMPGFILMMALSILCWPTRTLAQNNYPATGNVGINLGSSTSQNKLQIGSNPQGWLGNDLVVSGDNTRGAVAISSDASHSFLYGDRDVAIRPGFGKWSVYTKGTTGYVGIGFTNPAAMLHVQQGSNTDWAAVVQNTGGDGKGLKIQGAAANITPVLQVEDNSGANRFLVRSDGNVGIGTPNPSTNLDVQGHVNIGGSYSNPEGFHKSLSLTGTDHSILRITGSTVKASFWTDNTVAEPKVRLGTNSNNGLGFFVNGATNVQLYMAPTGNVNVGTTSVANAKFYVQQSSNTDWAAFINNDGGSGKGLRIKGASGDGPTPLLQVEDNLDNKRFVVLTNGLVGIGTANPDHKLTVKGIIHSEEVRVDLSVPGPDYVFEKDYDLLPLSELETYIKQNKHLPEVPSAKEMEADGINLKEMNLLLLKKVEELTLHLIEKDKKISAIEKRLEQLEKD